MSAEALRRVSAQTGRSRSPRSVECPRRAPRDHECSTADMAFSVLLRECLFCGFYRRDDHDVARIVRTAVSRRT